MNFSEAVVIATDSLWAHKLRSVLTLLGVAVVRAWLHVAAESGSHVVVRNEGRSPLADLDRRFFLYDRPVRGLCATGWSTSLRGAGEWVGPEGWRRWRGRRVTPSRSGGCPGWGGGRCCGRAATCGEAAG